MKKKIVLLFALILCAFGNAAADFYYDTWHEFYNEWGAAAKKYSYVNISVEPVDYEGDGNFARDGSDDEIISFYCEIPGQPRCAWAVFAYEPFALSDFGFLNEGTWFKLPQQYNKAKKAWNAISGIPVPAPVSSEFPILPLALILSVIIIVILIVILVIKLSAKKPAVRYYSHANSSGANQTSSTDKRFCTNCGTALEATTKFCPKCGAGV